jgi:predicted O-linked N-acetylglucosamine transferase (SPINDLY family)
VIAEWDRVSRKDLLTGISPLSLAYLADDPIFQLAAACRHAKTTVGIPKSVQNQGANPNARQRDSLKLRIGYLSSDLRGHAVGYAMSDVTETHDRENFEIFAYYCGTLLSQHSRWVRR